MFSRRNVYKIIFALSISLGLLGILLFTFQTKALACTESWECPDYFGPNYCCTNANGQSALCNDWAGGVCSGGECTHGLGRSTRLHTDYCAYGCTNGACNSPPPPTCDPRNGQECGTYGCCSPNNVESECYKQYTCSGSCEPAGYRNEGAYCGNGACSCNENSQNCPADCGAPPPTCPNNRCDNGETCTTCPQDCGSCPTPPPTCPNGSCDNGETCSTCPQDCGTCSTPPPTPPSCNTTPLTITPNPANISQTMYFKYNPNQDTYLGGDTWNPPSSVSGCRLDTSNGYLNRQYICTAAQTTTGGIWTHKWNNQSCTKTSPPYTICDAINAYITPNPVPARQPVTFTFTSNLGYTSVNLNTGGGASNCTLTNASCTGNPMGDGKRCWWRWGCTAGSTAGNYTATFTNSQSCPKTATYTINNPRPPLPTITPPSCIFPGYNGSGVTISWGAINPRVTYVDISTNGSFSPYYNKAIASGTSTTAPAGFSGGLTLNPGTTYYVRTWNGIMHSPIATFNIPLCIPAAPTVLPPSCSAPVGNRATVSWRASTGATAYALRVDKDPSTWNGKCYDPYPPNPGDVCSYPTATSETFTSTPGASYSWWVHACNAAGCSAKTDGLNFTCGLPTCPGGLGACGGSPGANGAPDSRTIGVCNGIWQPNHGLSLAYDIWCATNANPARGYCYQCNTEITPWIQTTGDVHSNTGINAPGGP